MIVDEHKVVFIHIPKNAGSSVKAFFENKEFPFKHKTIEQIKTENPKAYNSYRKFTIVRNPYDRMVSWYFYLKRSMEGEHIRGDFRWRSGEYLPSSFSEWVKEPLKEYYPRWKLSDVRDDIHTDIEFVGGGRENGIPLLSSQYLWLDETVKVLKYEKLKEELNKFFNKEIDIPKSNESKRKNYKNYYNRECLDIVYDRYKEDFKKYNYKKL